MVIAVVDYGAGNLRSVKNALEYLGAEYFVSNKAEKLMSGDKLIFPGVGHAASAMKNLEAEGLGQMIKEYVATGRLMLGVCLGSQIILESSQEGDSECLGIIKGSCELLPSEQQKVPHIGWNHVYPTQNHYLFKDIEAGASFYFVHSYYTKPEFAENVLCETDYGIRFACGIQKDNVSAVQFHPERSGRWGLKLLENFISA